MQEMVDWASGTSHMQHNDPCEQLPALHQRLTAFQQLDKRRGCWMPKVAMQSLHRSDCFNSIGGHQLDVGTNMLAIFSNSANEVTDGRRLIDHESCGQH